MRRMIIVALLCALSYAQTEKQTYPESKIGIWNWLFGSEDENLEQGEIPALPIPEEIYEGSISACPFSSWYGPSLISNPDAADFAEWETHNLETSEASWEEQQRLVGWEYDDHPVLDTSLGQGPTMGFVTAKLEIDPVALPEDARVGIFETAQNFDSVVRFSGFDAGVKLARMALKINVPEAWYGEVNWLFTETLPVFVHDDFNDIAASVNGAWFTGWESAFWNTMGISFGFLWSEYVMGNTPEIPRKNFFSQLPYALGEKYAMKMEFIPLDSADGCQPGEESDSESGTRSWELDRANALSKALGLCDLQYELYLKVLEVEGNEYLINKQSTRAWNNADVYSVGLLTIPMQALETITGQSEELQTYLDSKFSLGQNSPIAHKLFRFHPIATIEEHQPLGEVQSFRAGFYSHHAKLRGETLQQGLARALKFPFEEDYTSLVGNAESALAKIQERRKQKKYTESGVGHSTLAIDNAAELAMYGFAIIGVLSIVRQILISFCTKNKYEAVMEPEV